MIKYTYKTSLKYELFCNLINSMIVNPIEKNYLKLNKNNKYLKTLLRFTSIFPVFNKILTISTLPFSTDTFNAVLLIIFIKFHQIK